MTDEQHAEAGELGSWPQVDQSHAAWLGQAGWTGHEIGSRPDSAWVLHAMYEREPASASTTHAEVERTQLDAGLVARDGDAGFDPDAAGTATGSVVGRSARPGPGWRRLRWAELADRIGEPVVPHGIPPCSRCLAAAHPSGSWAASIQPPAEGSLDREGWSRLVKQLAGWSPDGDATACLAYFSPAQSDWTRPGRVVAGQLADAVALYDHPFGHGSPANFWSHDRSWVTWSDWDLWGTKVAGPACLVELLLADDELEAARLPWC